MKYQHFLPRRIKRGETTRLENSVYRTDSMRLSNVWSLGIRVFERVTHRTILGRAIGKAEAIFQVGLAFDPDGRPHFRHANIIGWAENPSVPDKEQKNVWMIKAQDLCKAFKYQAR